MGDTRNLKVQTSRYLVDSTPSHSLALARAKSVLGISTLGLTDKSP